MNVCIYLKHLLSEIGVIENIGCILNVHCFTYEVIMITQTKSYDWII